LAFYSRPLGARAAGSNGGFEEVGTGKKERETRRVIDLSLLRCSRGCCLISLDWNERKEDERRVGDWRRKCNDHFHHASILMIVQFSRSWQRWKKFPSFLTATTPENRSHRSEWRVPRCWVSKWHVAEKFWGDLHDALWETWNVSEYYEHQSTRKLLSPCLTNYYSFRISPFSYSIVF